MSTRLKVFSFVFLAVLASSLAFLIKSARTADANLSFVVIPDAQSESREVIDAICQWVVDNKTDQNIQAVIGLGDLTNYATDAEFQRVTPCFDRLNAADIINVPIMGNHDYDNYAPQNRVAAKFDQYFGPARFANKTWYGGNYNGSNANYYVKFTFGSRKFLILALEFFPRPAVVNWASAVLDQNWDSEVIVTTHGYLNPNKTRITDGDTTGPTFYSLPAADNSGEDLWLNLLKKKGNVKLVVSGHQLDGTTAFRSDTGEKGNTVNQLFNNFQLMTDGNGWLGVIKLDSVTGKASVKYVKAYPPTYNLNWSAGTVAPANKAPAVNAGLDQNIILPATVSLSGTATDDGLPAGSSLTISWSKVSGPGGVTFSNSGAVVTTASFSAAGQYLLRLTASDGSLSASDDIIISVNSTISTWYDTAWPYRKIITINRAKVAGNLASFPVLVSITDADLKSTDNGGKVGNINGFDFVFTNSANTKLAHEIEKYDPATGQLLVWVNVPQISNASDTRLNLYFGNATAANQQNKTSVWDSHFMAVWHLNEKSGNQLDATSQNYNSTVLALSGQGTAVGKINDADYFASATDYISFPATATNLKKQFSQISVSAWVSPASYGAGYWGPTIISNTDGDGWAMRINDGYLEPDFRLSNGNIMLKMGPQLPLNAWSYVNLVYDGAKITGYVNGVSVGSTIATGTMKNSANSNTCTFLGNDPLYCTVTVNEFNFNGNLDEVRVSDSARSAAWIATEYANQSNPAAFLTAGATESKP